MKKLFNVLAVVVLALVLSIGATRPTSNIGSDEIAAQGTIGRRQTTISFNTKVRIPTVAEICQGYLNADPQFEMLYQEEGDGWIRINGLGSYHPGTTYDGNWRDIDAVIASYYQNKQSWILYANEIWMIWTADYGHSFSVWEHDPYWLRLDGDKVFPLIEQTYTLDPMSLITDYQTGIWEGEPRHSEDYCTKAELDEWHGRIRYNYERPVSYADEDPLKFVSSASPSYEKDDVSIEEAYRNTGSLGVVEIGRAVSKAYIDLPIGSKLTPIDSLYMGEYGTFFLTEDGVSQFCKGSLIQEWKFNVVDCEDTFMAIINPDTNDSYVYNGAGEFIRLCADGTTEILMYDVIGAWYNGEGTIEVFSLHDSILSFGHHQDGDFVISEIDHDVKSAYFWRGAIYEKGDSIYYFDAYAYERYQATPELLTSETLYDIIMDIEHFSPDKADAIRQWM